MEHAFHMVRATGTQAIDRAARLLVRVVESARPLGVGELSAQESLPKSTTSRLLTALERQGLVQRDVAGLRPGPVLVRFAGRDGTAALVELARPSMRRLADASGETINLAGPGLDGVEHLAQEDTAHFVGVTDWVGRRVPFELATNGKCFLTFGGGGCPQADEIRRNGYATSVDELEVGLTAVAAPVFGAQGVAIAALSISGPTARLMKERVDELAPLLVGEASAVSIQLRGAA